MCLLILTFFSLSGDEGEEEGAEELSKSSELFLTLMPGLGEVNELASS
jgi:hypothetical protein